MISHTYLLCFLISYIFQIIQKRKRINKQKKNKIHKTYNVHRAHSLHTNIHVHIYNHMHMHMYTLMESPKKKEYSQFVLDRNKMIMNCIYCMYTLYLFF